MLSALAVVTALAAGDASCPAAEYLPQLTIDKVRDPAVPVVDSWQVYWGPVALSDAQLAELSQTDAYIDRTRVEMEARGTWVYVGTGLAALGTALSSVGWVLYGQDELSQGYTLPLALGGIAMGVAGLLITTESIQTPLEPHLAPTPVHRLTREEARAVVADVNRRMYEEICEAARVDPNAQR